MDENVKIRDETAKKTRKITVEKKKWKNREKSEK